MGGGVSGVAGKDGEPANVGGGDPDPDAYHGPVDLCLSEGESPDSWASEAGAGSSSCGRGVLGPFVFDGCRYELLDPTPANVDPFTGGHSRCCYRSRLLGCP
jgi:hypothetical protein